MAALCLFSLLSHLLCLAHESETNAATFKGTEQLSHCSTLLKIRLCNSLTLSVPQPGIKPLISWLGHCLAAILGHAFHSDKSQQSFISFGHSHNVSRLKHGGQWFSNWDRWTDGRTLLIPRENSLKTSSLWLLKSSYSGEDHNPV